MAAERSEHVIKGDVVLVGIPRLRKFTEGIGEVSAGQIPEFDEREKEPSEGSLALDSKAELSLRAFDAKGLLGFADHRLDAPASGISF